MYINFKCLSVCCVCCVHLYNAMNDYECSLHNVNANIWIYIYEMNTLFVSSKQFKKRENRNKYSNSKRRWKNVVYYEKWNVPLKMVLFRNYIWMFFEYFMWLYCLCHCATVHTQTMKWNEWVLLFVHFVHCSLTHNNYFKHSTTRFSNFREMALYED